MPSSDQRDGERVPTFIRVRLKFASVHSFIEKYSTNISLGGIFIQSRSPKPPGTLLRFEMALQGGETLIRGDGRVTWVKEFDPEAPGQPFGMGVRFTNLDPKSRALVERAVAHRQGRGGGGGEAGFTTTPPVPKAQPAPALPSAAADGSPDFSHVDADLAGLMREAGLTEDKVAAVAARAKRMAGGVDGDLAALARPPAPEVRGTPPPALPRLQASQAAPSPPPAGGLASAGPPPAGDETPAGTEVGAAEAASPSQAVLAGALFDDTDLEGAELMLESLQNPGPGEGPGEEPMGEESSDEPPEITAVGAPPEFADMPAEMMDDEPPLFPEREVVTPPPETEGPLFAPDAPVTPSQPAVEEEPRAPSAAERWAAAAGPETADLDDELGQAMESVIEPSPAGESQPRRTASPPKREGARRSAARESGARAAHKGKKGILGRLFKKKS